MKRGKLRRKTPLKRTAFRQQPSKNSGFTQAVKNNVWRRSAGACQACASRFCTGLIEHYHHRRLRSQGGPNTEENCLGVCGICHEYIHAHPEEAARRGWILRRFSCE